MADHFLAEIRVFGFNFPPTGWAFCNGQLLPISQNTALFSLLGTTYGGDGKSTFRLPDLQGSAPMHRGLGTDYTLGAQGGSATVTLLQSEMPSHNHSLRAVAQDPADVGLVSSNATFAQATGGSPYQPAADGTLAFEALTVIGGSLPHNNMQPYLSLNFCIALQGVFPQRP